MSDNGLPKTTINEAEGVHLGQHVVTGDDIIVDLFSRPDNLNSLVLGDPDSGKLAGVGRLLTQLAQNDEAVILVVDPLEELTELNAKLGGEHVIIGEEMNLNPLELRKTPPTVRKQAADVDPYREKIDQVIDFFDGYFGLIGQELNDTHRGVFGYAIDEAYDRHGITDNPATHGQSNPTVRDVGDVLAELAQNPQLPVYTETKITDTKRREWQACARELVDAMKPLQPGGKLSHLGYKTNINLMEAPVTYLNLRKTTRLPEVGLSLKQLTGTVYQQAKRTEKRVLLAINAAHCLLRDMGHVDWMAHMTQSSCHHDLSVQFITHRIEEFLTPESGSAITGNCSLKLLHHIEEFTDDQASYLQLSDVEVTFVRNAALGSVDSDSPQALLVVDNIGRIPIQFAPSSVSSRASSSKNEGEN